MIADLRLLLKCKQVAGFVSGTSPDQCE